MVRKARWSFKDDRRLMELARSSTSLEEVVKQTGRSPEAIKRAAMRLGISIKSQAKKKRLRAENSNPDAESLGPLISERGKQYRRCRHHYAQNRQLLDVVLSDAAKDLFLVATDWRVTTRLRCDCLVHGSVSQRPWAFAR